MRCQHHPQLNVLPYLADFIANGQILRKLVDNLSIPVSCKIRLLPTQSATLGLVAQIIETGISCLTVHCRTPDMRPREPALLDRLREIVDLVHASHPEIPVVANGDCLGDYDAQRVRDLTGSFHAFISARQCAD